MPAYQPTPLVALDQLAHTLGVSGIWVKDESKRFGLKAFNTPFREQNILGRIGFFNISKIIEHWVSAGPCLIPMKSNAPGIFGSLWIIKNSISSLGY